LATAGWRSDLLADPGGLAAALTEVVELRTAYIATALDLDVGHRGAVQREHPLHSLAVGHLADREGRIQATVAAGHHHTLVGLEALAVALLDLDLDHHRVTGGKVRNVLLEGFCFEGLDNFAHDSISRCYLSVLKLCLS